MQAITDAEIKIDIQKYRNRIDQAEKKLADLPDAAYGWQGQKELSRKQRILLDEIRHCNHLIGIAKEALTGIEV